MRTVAYIRFDEEEREAICRTLAGEDWEPLTRFRNRVRQDEVFGSEFLASIAADLSELVSELQPQTVPEWWRSVGAPGADDAIEGLARERQIQVERLVDVRLLVKRAAEEV